MLAFNNNLSSEDPETTLNPKPFDRQDFEPYNTYNTQACYHHKEVKMVLPAAILLAFIPALFYAWIVYWMDRYEKEPRILLGGVFIWGAVVAAGGAYILNTVFGIAVYAVTTDIFLTDLATGSFSAPLVEELLKGLAVLLVFLIFRHEFDSILDGIVYAAITALGFAATENVLYMVQFGYAESGWDGLWYIFFLRVVLGAWNHATYTAFTGIGLAAARLSRSSAAKVLLPIVGFSLSLFTHFLHNTIATFAQAEGGLLLLFAVDWLGWLFILGIMTWAIRRERMWIRFHLKQEVANGLISPQQYNVVLSPLKRNMAKINGLGKGQYRQTRQFYRFCTELAFKKQQIARLGSSRGNTMEDIHSLRNQIAQLAPKAGI
jgi:RsiW-degrading membrane proteinase PrsW (M82 family)